MEIKSRDAVSLTRSFYTLILGLSKWVRQLVKHHDSFTSAMQSLLTFSQSQQGDIQSHTEELSHTNTESLQTALQPPPELLKLHQGLSSESQITGNSVNHPSEAGTWSHSIMKSLILLTQTQECYFKDKLCVPFLYGKHLLKKCRKFS